MPTDLNGELPDEPFQALLHVLFHGKRLQMGPSASWLEIAQSVHSDFSANFNDLYDASANSLWIWRFIAAAGCIREMLELVEPQPALGRFVQPLPEWVNSYLLRVAQELADLSARLEHQETSVSQGAGPPIASARATELVPAALGLTRPGWNAFTAFRAQRRDNVDMHYLDFFSSHLRKSKTALIQELADMRGIEDTRVVRRRISKTRKSRRTRR